MRRFVYVDDGVPEDGTGFIRASCEDRGLAFTPVDPRHFDFDPRWQLGPGDILYRPAVSFLAQKVEQFLHGPGVSTFYADDDGVYFGLQNPTLAYQRAGLPVPRTIFCQTRDRSVLNTYVERLGGFPIVYKVPGYSTGIGVGRIDSVGVLHQTVDLLITMGRHLLLMPFIEGVHWRLVVVGDRVVASYRNVATDDDFRSCVTTDLDDYEATPSPRAESIAVRSTQVGRLEFGGVDLLEHPSGRLYLLENNFPCYYAQAQKVAGVDVSGAMVDHLVAKAERLEARPGD